MPLKMLDAYVAPHSLAIFLLEELTACQKIRITVKILLVTGRGGL
jgi:hypothetical protein